MELLTKDQIAELAPSVFATSHDGNRSDRYTFVSSEKIIDEFRDLGWGVASAQQPNSRVSDPMHNKHLLRFRPLDSGFAFRDPRNGQDVFPEIVSLNSSNGTCRWKMLGGAFTMVCANGLIIRMQGFEAIEEEFSRKHIGWDPQLAYDATKNMSDSFSEFFKTVSDMTQYDLSDNQRTDMAVTARDLRFSDTHMDEQQLLTPRRAEDMGRDLWTTFNVLQENCVRGGFKLAKRTARELTNIDALEKVNSGLWASAEKQLVLAG